MERIVHKIRDAYKSESAKNPVATLLFTLLFLFLVVWIIVGIITSGKSMLAMFWYDHKDVFMDYFNSIMYSSDKPYSYYKVIYPPLATTFYAIIGHFTIPFVDVEPGETLSFVLRGSQMGIMSFFVITLLTLFVFHWILKKLIQNKDVLIKIEVLFFLLVLSYPLLYALERGNNIIMVIIFCFVFLMGYRSENKVVRYISYISLGCAAGFKLYPALFGLLVLREREWKEALICGLIGVAMVFVPFIFTDGNPMMLLDAISAHTSTINLGGSVNISQMTYGILHTFVPTISVDTVGMIGNILVMILILLSAIVILFDKKMNFWKIVTLIACNLVLGPGVGSAYLYIYLIIPVVYFLLSEKHLTKENTFFIICFTMIIAVFFGFEFGGSWVTLALIKSVFVLAMAAVIIYQGLKNIYENRNNIQLTNEEQSIS